MRINHNISALNTYRQLAFNNTQAAKNMEKLSSGLRINRAGDDAAGLAISEKMRGQIRGLEQASRNAQDAISLIQTAEGALNETHSILQRMRELAVQASNDTATDDDRKEIQKEINQLIDEIDRIATDTEFNTKTLLTGTYENSGSGLTMHIGANAGQNMEILISDMRSTALGSVATDGGTSVTSTASIRTNYDSTSSLDMSFTITDGNSNNITITLDRDFGNAGAVVDYINNQIQSDINFKDQVKAKLLDGNKITFIALDNDTYTIANGGGSVTVDAALFITDGGTISNTGTTVNSLQVNPDTSTSGGVLTQADANAAITVLDDAIKQVSAERSRLGAYQNRLEHSINNLGTSAENLTAAESRIRDVDYALVA
jgi:flagellin